MKIVRYGDDGNVVKEWEVLVTAHGYEERHSGISGVYSDSEPQKGDILVDDEERRFRVDISSPATPAGWFTLHWSEISPI